MHRLRTVLAAAGVVAAVLTISTACGGDDDSDTADSGRLSVVASTDVWGSVVAAVGGDLVEVTSLIDDPSADPHSYEATPAQSAAMREADLVVYNGGGYDGFAQDIVADSGDLTSVDAFEVSGHPDGENEHVWYEMATVQAVAVEVARVLGEADPDNAATYEANAAGFGTRVDALVGEIATIATAHTGTKIATTEPLAHYLVDAAGLEDVTPPEFVEAIEEESDPPAAAVAATRALVSAAGNIAALIFNPQTETPVIAGLRDDVRSAGIPVVEMTETLPPGTDYLTWMQAQVTALRDALP